jgi:hypothetical protein
VQRGRVNGRRTTMSKDNIRIVSPILAIVMTALAVIVSTS